MSLDATINFGNVVTGSAAKPGAINATFFYARWTGYLVPSVSGKYTLGLNVQGGANLFINDTPLVLAIASTLTANSTTTANRSGQIELTAGVHYPITVEWQHGTGSPYELQLLWIPPGGSVQVIPAGNLSTSQTSVTSNITGTWWNGTSGLWYPAGPGVIDFASTQHPNKNLDNVADGTRAAWDSGTQKGAAVDSSGNLKLKNIVNAVGSTSGPTTTSTTFVTIPEMTATITTKGNKVLITFSGTFLFSGTLTSGLITAFAAIFKDGVQVSGWSAHAVFPTTALGSFTLALSFVDSPTATSHTYDVRWSMGSGSSLTLTGVSTNRQLQVVELG